MKTKLTSKQRLFADEYIKSGNAAQSAVKAGYNVKSAKVIGAQNLSKLNVKTYIEAKMAEIESHKIADAKEVLQYLTRVLRGEENGEVIEFSTRAYITPGYTFLVIDELITNFHLPRSTPLMLVAAFMGTSGLKRAYQQAIAGGYRFYSYGDAMFIS